MFARVILALLMTLAGHAQVLRFERYSTSDGLLSDEVYNLYQDREGFLWIFTNYGALKYNGTEFRPVLTNLSINEAFVYSFSEHPSGRKWVATSGANIYEVKNDSVYPVKGTEDVSKSLSQSIHEIFDLHVDDSLNIYAVTKQVSYKFSPSPSGYKAQALSGGPGDTVNFRIYDKHRFMLGFLNFNGNDTVFCGGIGVIRTLLCQAGDTSFHRIACQITTLKHIKRFGDDIYIGHHDQLIRIRNGKVKSIPINALVLNYTRDENGHVWVACYNKGLVELDENDSIINRYFKNITVNDVLIDSQKGIWASTVGFGLYHSANLNHKFFDSPHDLSNPVALVKRIPRGLVVGTRKGDIFLCKEPGATALRLHEGQGEEVFDVEEIENQLYMLFRFTLKRLQFDKAAPPENLLDRTVNAQKLMVMNDSLFLVHRKRVSLFTESRAVLQYNFKQRIYALGFGQGHTYAGLEDGLYELVGKPLKELKLLGKSNVKVSQIAKTLQQQLVFCSKGHGVFFRGKGDSLIQLDMSRGLPYDIVNNVIFDSSGVLLATANGLYYSPDAMIPLGQMQWKKIFNGNIEQASVFGEYIYVGTVHGLVILDKSRISDPPDIHFSINAFRVNGRKVSGEQLGSLPYSDNTVELFYDLITFNKVKHPVRYRLSGPYSDSGSVSAGSIKISHLPPGSYHLEVFPLVKNGRLHTKRISFVIQPAFWQTNLFIAMAILLPLLLMALGGMAVGRYFRRKREKRAAVENKLLEYKLIALKAQINPHFMSNCLSAIQHLIVRNKLDQATDYIAKFGFLVRQILNYSDRSLIKLKDELSLARLYMDLEQLRFDQRFRYEVALENNVDDENIFIPALILNPIIENAIWHGLVPVTGDRTCKVSIHVKITDDLVELSITDNGVGRQNVVAKVQGERESRGMNLIQQRLDNLNHLYGTRSCQVIYSDNIEDGEARGTRVSLLIPADLKPLAHA